MVPRLFAVLVALLLAGGPAAPVAAAGPRTLAPLLAATGTVIPSHYLVSVKAGQRPRDVAASLGLAPDREWTNAGNGFAATLDAGQLAALRRHPQVVVVEPDQEVGIATTQANPPSWGLDRIDQRALPLSRSYGYAGTGRGVSAYVIDTGIDTTHPDFGGRASIGTNLIPFEADTDLNGHGTHVAGILGGTIYGVAKGVTLVGVKVLDGTGRGPLSTILAGLDWVTGDHQAGVPAVANLSISGPASTLFDDAINALVADGVFLTVAAGNFGIDACQTSPASVSGAFAVAASDIADQHTSFSNFGPCVDLYAPGLNIVSDWVPTAPGRVATLSGTSQAAPHVAGAAALYLETNPQATPAAVRARLVATATPNAIHGVPADTPNLLLYVGPLPTTISTGGVARYRGAMTLTATLKYLDGTPVSGVVVAFSVRSVVQCSLGGGPSACPRTDTSGVARLTIAMSLIAPGTFPNLVGATFAGDASASPSSGQGTLAVTTGP